VFLQLVRTLVISILCLASAAYAAETASISAAPTSLERGYNHAYNLDFTGAQHEFAAWEKAHPGEALGPVSEGAGYLFSELNRLGVLETQFFSDDKKFLDRPKVSPDPKTKQQFDDALTRAESEAQQELGANPRDPDALFAMTLTYGLRADYVALVEKRNMASLSLTKQADGWAEKLLSQHPSYYDGYLATGLSKYILGSLAAPVRWLLRLGGYSGGDKKEGMKELQLVAERGHYLAPFARMLLAIAYLRQKDPAKARTLLEGLRQDFPGNPLFTKEIARLDEAH
jgi:hypothetical protein